MDPVRTMAALRWKEELTSFLSKKDCAMVLALSRVEEFP